MTDHWHRVAEFPPEQDLGPFCDELESRAVEFRMAEEAGARVLWIARRDQLDDTLSALQRHFGDDARSADADSGLVAGLKGQFLHTPVMMIALALSLLGAAIVQWQLQWVPMLTFQAFYFEGRGIRFDTLQNALEQGQYWRLITPIFIHFGLFHIAFNGLWLWEFGRRIEVTAGSLHLLVLILLSGVLSNWGQYLWGGPSLFGGMSGVIYALLGYIWLRNSLAPRPSLAVPKGIIVFMLGWLVLCMTGVVNAFMQGSIANAAHLSGLVAGMAAGAVFGLADRGRRVN